jgi:hypothetical protein
MYHSTVPQVLHCSEKSNVPPVESDCSRNQIELL